MPRARCGARCSGSSLGLVARLWLATLRVRVVLHPALERRGRPAVGPGVLARDAVAAPRVARRRRTVVLVSLSRDGAMQARALALQGLRVVRGSSSRGRRTRAGAARARDEARRGGRRVRRRRAAGAARGGQGRAPSWRRGRRAPSSSRRRGSTRRGLVLERAWDRFAIAWPFTRVDVVLGAPIEPDGRRRCARSRRAVARGSSTRLGRPRERPRRSSIDGVLRSPRGARS